MTWNKVWALGKDTYIRLFPNPGLGIRVGDKVFAVSLRRGFEVMTWHPGLGWVRDRRRA
jgi:hypothetical protein